MTTNAKQPSFARNATLRLTSPQQTTVRRLTSSGRFNSEFRRGRRTRLWPVSRAAESGRRKPITALTARKAGVGSEWSSPRRSFWQMALLARKPTNQTAVAWATRPATKFRQQWHPTKEPQSGHTRWLVCGPPHGERQPIKGRPVFVRWFSTMPTPLHRTRWATQLAAAYAVAERRTRGIASLGPRLKAGGCVPARQLIHHPQR